MLINYQYLTNVDVHRVWGSYINRAYKLKKWAICLYFVTSQKKCSYLVTMCLFFLKFADICIGGKIQRGEGDAEFGKWEVASRWSAVIYAAMDE